MENITFDNVRIENKKVKGSGNAHFLTGELVRGLEFE